MVVHSPGQDLIYLFALLQIHCVLSTPRSQGVSSVWRKLLSVLLRYEQRFVGHACV